MESAREKERERNYQTLEYEYDTMKRQSTARLNLHANSFARELALQDRQSGENLDSRR